MVQQAVDWNVVAQVVETFDCDAQYEDDQGTILVQGQVVLWYREPACFVLFCGREVQELPRY